MRSGVGLVVQQLRTGLKSVVPPAFWASSRRDIIDVPQAREGVKEAVKEFCKKRASNRGQFASFFPGRIGLALLNRI